MKIGPPPAASDPISTIVDYEHSRGSDDWAGPQGNADAWLMLSDYVSKTLPYRNYVMQVYTLAYGRI